MSNNNINVFTKSRRYSNVVKFLYIGVPAILYLFAAEASIDLAKTIHLSSVPNINDLAMATGLTVLRIGAESHEF